MIFFVFFLKKNAFSNKNASKTAPEQPHNTKISHKGTARARVCNKRNSHTVQNSTQQP